MTSDNLSKQIKDMEKFGFKPEVIEEPKPEQQAKYSDMMLMGTAEYRVIAITGIAVILLFLFSVPLMQYGAASSLVNWLPFFHHAIPKCAILPANNGC